MTQDYQITTEMQEITATVFWSVKDTVALQTNKDQKRPQFQFPEPIEESVEIFCDHDRVIKIYNKYNNDTRKKLTVTMEQWFNDQAKRCGWTETKFIKCDGTTKKACLLVKEIKQESMNASKH